MRTIRKPKAPSQHQLDRLIWSTRGKVRGLTDRLNRGDINVLQFESFLAELLEDAHAAAIGLGRRRAGDHTPNVPDDRILAQLTMQSERGFLDGFVRDLQSGKYVRDDGSVDRDAINRRSQMYANRVSGSASEAFVLASEPSAKFHWRLGAAEHCPTCLRLAAKGPYLDRELPTYPRAGATDCGTSCRCHLERDDGVRGFGPTPKDKGKVVREGSDEEEDQEREFSRAQKLELVRDFKGDLDAAQKYIEEELERFAEAMDREVFMGATKKALVYRKFGGKRSYHLPSDEDEMFIGGIRAHTHPGGLPPSREDLAGMVENAPAFQIVMARGRRKYVLSVHGAVSRALILAELTSARSDADKSGAARGSREWDVAYYKAARKRTEELGLQVQEFVV